MVYQTVDSLDTLQRGRILPYELLPLPLSSVRISLSSPISILLLDILTTLIGIIPGLLGLASPTAANAIFAMTTVGKRRAIYRPTLNCYLTSLLNYF
jgi:hypothetical protein